MLKKRRQELLQLRNEINRRIREVERQIVTQICPFQVGDVVEHELYGIFKIAHIVYNPAYFANEPEYRLIGKRLLPERHQFSSREEDLAISRHWYRIGSATDDGEPQPARHPEQKIS